MEFKKFDLFVNENNLSSTNRVSQETNLKKAHPDAEDSEEQDPYNPSIINVDAKKSGNVSFIGKKKTKGKSIDTFGNRTKTDNMKGGTIYGQSGVGESNVEEPKILGEGGMGDNQVAGQRVYTQNTDKSKQGYQDSMYYGDDEIDDHGPDCDCVDCLEKFAVS